jgi:hypothetical protein
VGLPDLFGLVGDVSTIGQSNEDHRSIGHAQIHGQIHGQPHSHSHSHSHIHSGSQQQAQKLVQQQAMYNRDQPPQAVQYETNLTQSLMAELEETKKRLERSQAAHEAATHALHEVQRRSASASPPSPHDTMPMSGMRDMSHQELLESTDDGLLLWGDDPLPPPPVAHPADHHHHVARFSPPQMHMQAPISAMVLAPVPSAQAPVAHANEPLVGAASKSEFNAPLDNHHQPSSPAAEPTPFSYHSDRRRYSSVSHGGCTSYSSHGGYGGSNGVYGSSNGVYGGGGPAPSTTAAALPPMPRAYSAPTMVNQSISPQEAAFGRGRRGGEGAVAGESIDRWERVQVKMSLMSSPEAGSKRGHSPSPPSARRAASATYETPLSGVHPGKRMAFVKIEPKMIKAELGAPGPPPLFAEGAEAAAPPALRALRNAAGNWEEWVLALGTRDRNKLGRERNMQISDLEDLRRVVRRRQWSAASRRYSVSKKSRPCSRSAPAPEPVPISGASM